MEAKVLFYFLKQKFSLCSSQITASCNIYILQFSSELWMNTASPHTLYELQGNGLVYYILTLACRRFSALKPEHLLSFFPLGFGPSLFTGLGVALLFSFVPSPFLCSDSGGDWRPEIDVLSGGTFPRWRGDCGRGAAWGLGSLCLCCSRCGLRALRALAAPPGLHCPAAETAAGKARGTRFLSSLESRK